MGSKSNSTDNFALKTIYAVWIAVLPRLCVVSLSSCLHCGTFCCPAKPFDRKMSFEYWVLHELEHVSKLFT